MPTEYSPRIVTDGLVLCLDAGNKKSYSGSGTNWTDLSGNYITGSLINGPVFNSGSLGNILFDGGNDYSIFNLTPLNMNVDGPYTISVFLRYLVTNSVRNPITLTNTSDKAFQFGYIGGNPVVWRYGGTTITPYSPPSANIIYNITCTVQSSNVTVYINGVQNSTTNTPNLQTGTLNYLIYSGYWAAGVINTSSAFNGNIYNTTLYNRILSPTEIQRNYNALKGRFGL